MQQRGRYFHHEAILNNFPASKPIAAISDPPRNEYDGNARDQTPPNWQQEIGKQAEHNEDQPEDSAFHEEIVGSEGIYEEIQKREGFIVFSDYRYPKFTVAPLLHNP